MATHMFQQHGHYHDNTITTHLYGQMLTTMALMLYRVVLEKQITPQRIVVVGVQDPDHSVIAMVYANHTTVHNGLYMAREDISKQMKVQAAVQHSYEVTNTDHSFKKKHKHGHTRAAQVFQTLHIQAPMLVSWKERPTSVVCLRVTNLNGK